jgi:hypothetical protein
MTGRTRFRRPHAVLTSARCRDGKPATGDGTAKLLLSRYAAEAGAAVLSWAFEKRGHQRVICLIRPENIPSLRVAVRLNLRPEKHVVFKGFNHLVFVEVRSQESGDRMAPL